MKKKKPLTRWERLVTKYTTDLGIRAALIDRGRHKYGGEDGDDRTEPDSLVGWFHAVKAAICLKRGWEYSQERHGDGEGDYGYLNGIEIGWHSGASYYSMDCMNAYGWNTVYVGAGVFRNWWAGDHYDTNC